MPERFKTIYNRPQYDTINQQKIDIPEVLPTGLRTGPQELGDPLDVGIRPFEEVGARRASLQSGWEQLGNASA